MIRKDPIFNEDYFRGNKGHFVKIKRRNCEENFEIWRATKKELDLEYQDFLKIVKFVKKDKLSKKQQAKSLKDLRKIIKSFSLAVYAYKEKTKNFLTAYLSKQEYRDELANNLYNLIIEKHFYTAYISFFIRLHNSMKHSGNFRILAFNNTKDNSKDFYVVNFSIKKEEKWIGILLDAPDIISYFKKANEYLNDIDNIIFHYMVRRS
jgi:hypothetical protein